MRARGCWTGSAPSKPASERTRHIASSRCLWVGSYRIAQSTRATPSTRAISGRSMDGSPRRKMIPRLPCCRLRTSASSSRRERWRKARQARPNGHEDASLACANTAVSTASRAAGDGAGAAALSSAMNAKLTGPAAREAALRAGLSSKRQSAALRRMSDPPGAWGPASTGSISALGFFGCGVAIKDNPEFRDLKKVE
jgi:hypothetical protein